MAQLPTRPESPTVAAMRAWWEASLQRNSRRLGASQIGEDCERRLWYSFRWVNAGERPFDGRMLRLFDRGRREEATFIAELRGAGLEVWDIDPRTGEQFTFTACAGHFVAKIDGVCRGVKEAPKALHVLSFKTANDDGYKEIVKNGPGPKYEAQSQIEMRLAEIDRTLFLVVNKNDDRVHGERLRAEPDRAAAIEAKAERVIFAPEPPPGISSDAAFYKCKQCPAAGVCHGDKLPAVNCRTCLHATPERDGDGRWSCALADEGLAIPDEFQARGCGQHRYVPALLAKWGEAVDASEAEGWVLYRAKDGLEFRNGATGVGSYTSAELRAASPALLRDRAFLEIRNSTGGVIVQGEAA
jgi:hypothetical protein